MAYQVTNLSVDLLTDRASVSMNDPETGTHLSVVVRVETPGNKSEKQLKEIARAAAKKALMDASEAL